MKYILSFSGGKDSTFLFLELIRRGWRLDEVVFFDTGWEFPAMYKHIELIIEICEARGIKFVTLHPEKPFDYYAFEHPHTSRKDGITRYGYNWCGDICRWGTGYKLLALNKYSEENKGNIVYVGIAADETERLIKEREEYKRFPLAEWGITEAECLQGCYDAGFDWGGMYEHLDRLSCKFCKNKNLKELRNIRKYYPDVWEELKDYQTKTNRPYKGEGQSVFDLEKRFAFEDERTAAGLPIKGKEFFVELRKRSDNNAL